MSVINILFGSRTPSGFSLSGLVEFQADLTLEESHERSAEVTENPIESGAVVSDHVITNPERLRLEGFVTDAPAAARERAAGRTQGAFETLEQAWRNREPLTVVTGRKTYTDMIIVRLDMPRDRPSSMRFTMEFQAVTIVESQETQLAGGGGSTSQASGVNSAASGNPDLTQTKTDAGRQATREANESTQRRSSALYDLGQKAGVFP